jgi:hypothetical protein
MGKNIDKRLWGVLGKQQTYFSPQKQVEGKTKTPLNANAFDSWDAKRSRFKRIDGYDIGDAVQQGGVVPQVSSTPIITTPTPTPSITPSSTPEIDCIWNLTDENWENNSNDWNVCAPVLTPTMTQTNTQTQTTTPTPSITPTTTPTMTNTQTQTTTPTPSITPTNTNTPTTTTTSTPTPSAPSFNPLTLNPMIWIDFNDTSTLSLRSGQFVQSVSNKGNWTSFTGFSQTTAAIQPSWSASTMGTGMSAVTISNDFLQAPSNLTGSSWNTFAVMKYDGTNPFGLISINGGGGRAWSNLYPERNNSRYANYRIDTAGFEYRANFTGFTGFNTTHIAQGYMSNSATTIVDYMTVNNSGLTETITSNSVPSTGFPGSITSPVFRIINVDEFQTPISGEIGEIYMFDKELTSTQQTNLINFLKTKWGIA